MLPVSRVQFLTTLVLPPRRIHSAKGIAGAAPCSWLRSREVIRHSSCSGSLGSSGSPAKSRTCDQKTDCAYALIASNDVCEMRLVMAAVLTAQRETVKPVSRWAGRNRGARIAPAAATPPGTPPVTKAPTVRPRWEIPDVTPWPVAESSGLSREDSSCSECLRCSNLARGAPSSSSRS